MEGERLVHPAQLPGLEPARSGRPTNNPIEFLYDVNLQVTVELGRAEMTIREILDMGQGTVIELNKLAGEPVDILVNNKPIARGEVVVVDDMFGVRVIDVLSPYDRINSLK